MGRFDELIEASMNPGEGGIPDSIYDDLRTAHGDEMAIAVQEREQATTKVQELEGRISELQTQLYDKTVSAAAEPVQGENNADPDGDGDDDEPTGVDDLFGDDDK